MATQATIADLDGGRAGSGKSYFSRNLAHTLGFKRFSTDAIRTELFGRPDPEPLELYNVATFQALNQRVEEALLAGHSVIRDHMQHRSYWREAIGQHQAGLVEAQLMTIWIKKTPRFGARTSHGQRTATGSKNRTLPARSARKNRVLSRLHRVHPGR